MDTLSFIIGTDIGGTTFSSTLYNLNLDQIDHSPLAMISDFPKTDLLLQGIADQITELENRNNISPNRILGVGLACPGPLNPRSGIILETPNLPLFQEFPIASELRRIVNSPVIIENDANLFALGEWVYNHHRNPNVLVSITLGTGLGIGIVNHGQIFTGAHGMAAEYGISPIGAGNWEDEIAIRGIDKLSITKFNKVYSPKSLYELGSSGNIDALEIWTAYGVRLGTFLSHAINMIDPDLITIGGGISHAFPLFCDTMFREISRFSPAYRHFHCPVLESTEKEKSAKLGAAKWVKNNW